MRKQPLPLSFVVAGIALAGCTPAKGVTMKSTELIPDKADIAFGMEISPISNSPIADPLKALAESDQDMRAFSAAFVACGVDMNTLKVAMGTTMEGSDEDFVGIAESPGIGKEDVMKCFEKEVAKATGDEPGTLLFTTRSDVRIAPQEDGGWLIILNENMVAVVGSTWEDMIFERIEKPETRAGSGPIAEALKRTNTESHAWATMVFSDADRASFDGFAGAESMSDVTFAVDLSAGLKMHTGVHFSDAAKAAEFKQTIDDTLELSKGEITAAGVPQAVLDSLKLTVAEADVTADLEVPETELAGIASLVAMLAAG
jgi:hypothetical protein